MARRRMFSMDIIDTDFFLDLPISSQNLYFHLALRADDDGFIASPKRIMATVKGSDDDMKILVAKGFLIPFDSGVCVITHWRIHNYIQNDRYKPTLYEQERKTLITDVNGKYECIQDVSKMEPQVRLGEVRLGERTQEAPACQKPSYPNDYPRRIYDAWQAIPGVPKPPEFVNWIMTQEFRDVLTSIQGYHSDEVLGAIKNYGICLADPSTYWPKMLMGIRGFLRSGVFQACRPSCFPEAALLAKREAAETDDRQRAAVVRKVKAAPSPGPCECGGLLAANRLDGTACCQICGIWFRYDGEHWAQDHHEAPAGGEANVLGAFMDKIKAKGAEDA